MKVLVACEYSGTVRDAFISMGHEAMSCDLLPTDVPGPHYQGDVFDIINQGWDMMIAHPPCTYLCVSGLHWNKRVEGRDAKTDEALEFVKRLLDAPIQRIALENPVGCISKRIRKPEQIIQPRVARSSSVGRINVTTTARTKLPRHLTVGRLEARHGRE